MLINNDDLVLFQGDSITDTSRDRVNDSLGTGYAYITASLFSSLYPHKRCVLSIGASAVIGCVIWRSAGIGIALTFSPMFFRS